MSLVLRSAYDVAVRLAGAEAAAVLVHCSDGWDRTSQVSALSQLLVDPHLRTIRGFATLVEKDFGAFGRESELIADFPCNFELLLSLLSLLLL